MAVGVQRSKQDWLLTRRSVLFLFFRRCGFDLPSRVDPHAVRRFSAIPPTPSPRCCPRSWLDSPSAATGSARSPTAARTISCSTACSKRESASTDFWCRGFSPGHKKSMDRSFGLNESHPFLFNLVLILSFLRLAGVSNSIDGRDLAGVEPLFRAQLRAIRPPRRRSLRHQHAGRGDWLRRGRIFS